MTARVLFILGIIMMLRWLGVAAGSVVVISPLVHMDVASGEMPLCMALNVSQATLDATLQVFNFIGQLQGSAHTDPALPPRHMIAIEPELAALNDSFATC